MDYYDQIEEYLNNNLSESAKIAFEREMENDAKLKAAVENHNVAMDVVGSIFEGEVRKVIEDEQLIINNEKLIINNGGQEADGKSVGKEAKVWRMNWMKWVAAAAVIFVWIRMGMGPIWKKSNPKLLYAETLIVPVWPMERGKDGAALETSIVKYFTGSKIEAKSELKKDASIEAGYWLAEIYYKEMKFDSTLIYLPEESTDVNKKRRDKINYLKILSLYFNGDKKSAKEAFSNLPTDTDDFYIQKYSKLGF